MRSVRTRSSHVRLRCSPMQAMLLVLWAHAGEPGAASVYAGTWRYVGGAADEAARMRAIEATVAEMPFLFQPFALARIDAATPIPSRLTITVSGPEIRLGEGAPTDVTSRWDGTPVVHAGDGGAEETITRRLVGGRLVHEARQADGYGRDEYTIAADGTLALTVTIGSDQLPRPIRYTLHYRRAP